MKNYSRWSRASALLRVKPPSKTPITWVKPELVCEVAFTEWTGDGQMRHPVFLRLRDDKPAREVVRERPEALGG